MVFQSLFKVFAWREAQTDWGGLCGTTNRQATGLIMFCALLLITNHWFSPFAPRLAQALRRAGCYVRWVVLDVPGLYFSMGDAGDQLLWRRALHKVDGQVQTAINKKAMRHSSSRIATRW